MQNGNFSSAPARRTLDVQDYFDILRRHTAWIIGPAFAGLVIAVVVAFVWPDTYISSAIIRVVPPQVPENLVPTNVNSGMSERINAMYQTISSRGNLTNIINSYNLYPRDRQRKPLEDIVEDMRKAITVTGARNLGATAGTRRDSAAFQIAFAYENRLQAQKVTADLVGRFMTENTRERTTQSVLTTQFLRDQVEGAKRELDAVEGKLATYRQSFQGRLPEQMAQNQMQLTMLEQRTANINNALGRISQERLLLESDLRTLKSQKGSLTPAPDQEVRRERNMELEQQDRLILALETQLTNLREHYRDTYPDVQRLLTQLNTAKKVRERMQAKDEAERAAPRTASSRPDLQFEREQRLLDAAIERLETQLKGKSLEGEGYTKDLANVERQIRISQERISAAPASEQQYAELIRDEALAKEKYENLTKKRSQSAISEELERRQQGETLELLDPASLPETPAAPKRPVIVMSGLVLGLGIGLAMAAARETRDNTLKNLKDVRAYTQLNVLGSIPLLENDLVVRRRRRLGWLAWATACLVGMLVMSGSVFYYYATKI